VSLNDVFRNVGTGIDETKADPEKSAHENSNSSGKEAEKEFAHGKPRFSIDFQARGFSPPKSALTGGIRPGCTVRPHPNAP
jgi:hypothetical protein